MDFTLYWFMFPASILVATCAMLSGIGGAALFTPIFILVFPLLGPEYVLGSTIAAIGTALITQTFGFLSGFVGYYRRKLIDYRLATRIILVSVPVAVAGALTAGIVHDSVLLASYAVLIAVLSIVMWRNRPPTRADAAATTAMELCTIVDSKGHSYSYQMPRLGLRSKLLTGIGAFLTGMVSVGIGEVTISQLTRKGLPIAVAAATSVLVVITTVVFASTTDIPGVLIGGQIGPRLQGKISPHAMRRAISILFVLLSVAMMFVALRKLGTV
jgi:uncharacterized membrane protein YfcA